MSNIESIYSIITIEDKELGRNDSDDDEFVNEMAGEDGTLESLEELDNLELGFGFANVERVGMRSYIGKKGTNSMKCFRYNWYPNRKN